MERDAEAIWPGVLRVGLRRLDSGMSLSQTCSSWVHATLPKLLPGLAD